MEIDSSFSLKDSLKKDDDEFKPHPLLEVSDIISVTDGGDLYLAMENKRYQFHKTISPVFHNDEYTLDISLKKGEEICFVHKNGDKVPRHLPENCGYTLQGKAKELFEFKNALVTSNGNETYAYVNKDSSLFYKGEDTNQKLYLRIYDNCNGYINDRWVVIFIE